MKEKLLYMVAGAGILFLAMSVFGGDPSSVSTGSSTWRSLGGSGMPILYSRRGTVYRFFTECSGDRGKNGCLVELPVITR